ncbi:MAG: SH3 domain-containing protein [Lentisphaeria bacterium]|nr:SH3 domain-containing protein [Lentisphaeria bacterium]
MKYLSREVFALGLVLVLHMGAVSVFAESWPQAGVVTATQVNVRARPSTHYERIGQFRKDDILTVVSMKDGWYEVELNDNFVCWVTADSVAVNGDVLTEPCLLYSGPSLVFTSFGQVGKGSTLTIVGAEADNWRQVRVPEKATAWVSADYIALQDPPAPVKAEVVKSAAPAPAQVAPRLTEELARQQASLQVEAERLEALQAEAELIKQHTAEREKEIAVLRAEEERMQAMKTDAAKQLEAALMAREKADTSARLEQIRLEDLKKEAEKKAQTVSAERANWEAEAKRHADALAKAKAEADRLAAVAKAEADRLAKEQAGAAAQAEALRAKVVAAESAIKDGSTRHAELQLAIADVEKEKNEAQERLTKLQEEKKAVDLQVQRENELLNALKQQAAAITQEKQAVMVQIEQAKKEREELENKRLAEDKARADADAKRLAAEAAEKARADADAKRLAAEAEEKARADAEAKRLAAEAEEKARADAEAKRLAAEAEEKARADAEAKRLEAERLRLEAEKLPPKFSGNGLLVPLRPNSAGKATHALCEPRGERKELVAYLIAPYINLREWEDMRVQLDGMDVRPENWRYPLIEVRSIRPEPK